MTKTQCPKCGKLMRTEAGLEWHLRRIHRGDAEDGPVVQAAMAQEVVDQRLPTAERPQPDPTPEQPTELKQEVYISYVKAGS